MRRPNAIDLRGLRQMFRIHPMNAIRIAGKFTVLLFVVDAVLANLDKLIVG